MVVDGGDPAAGVGGTDDRGVSLILGRTSIPGVPGIVIESGLDCCEPGGGGKDAFGGEVAVGVPSGLGEAAEKLLLPPSLRVILAMMIPGPGRNPGGC